MKRLLAVGLGLVISAILTGCCCAPCCGTGGGCGFGGCGPGGCAAPMGVSYQQPCNGSCAY